MGRFHVKGPRKKVNVEKCIFFDEMLMIIRQIDDFGRFLNNFGNFWVFLAKNQKIPKNEYFERVKTENNFFL